MDDSNQSDLNTTVDARHIAAIDSARRQVEEAARRSATPRSDVAGPRTRDLMADSLPGYELGEEAHSGGQGIVYRAVQRGTQRQVAIKFMHERSAGAESGLARFEREIQILGQLKHPNIVTIHESGSSAAGLYFVMDYIDGAPLDGYVRDQRLDVRATLGLVAKIADAVHMAHLRGVIHRDLKPANIRVDRGGEPHVLDFGLAKFDDASSAGSRLVESQTGQFIGSLPWASPEQIEGRTVDIDVRTDVYSIGVILFQVLSGRLPFELHGNIREVVDTICRKEPPRPSSIRPEISDEVDAIVLRCLRKEKALRYQSAGDLALDIRRYLAGEPIQAKSDSGWYVATKVMRKHRVAVAIAAGFVLTITAGFVTSLNFWRRAVHDRDKAKLAQIAAVEARDEAEKNEAVANAVTHFLTQDVLLKVDPYNPDGEELKARTLFEQAARDVDGGAFRDQPRVEFEVRTVIGLVDLWRSDFGTAEEQFRRALPIARSEFGEHHDKSLLTMSRLGTALSRQGKLDEAGKLLREAVAAFSESSGDARTGLTLRSALAGWCLDTGVPEEAEKLYREILPERVRLQGAEDEATLAVMSKLAIALSSQEKYEEAESLLLRSIAAKRRVEGDDHPETLLDLMHYASTLQLSGRADESIGMAEEARDGLAKRLGPSSESAQSATLVLAKGHQLLGHLETADKLLREAMGLYLDSHGNAYQGVEIMLQLATNLYQQGNLTEAATFLRDALAAQERVGGGVKDRLRILSMLVNVLGSLGRSAEAVPIAREAVDLGGQVYGERSDTMVVFLNNYGYALMGSGQNAGAETQYRRAMALHRTLHGEDDALSYGLMHNLAITLGNQWKNEERETLLRTALAGRRKTLGDDDPMTLGTMHAMANALKDNGKVDDALTLFRELVNRAETVWPGDYYLKEHYRRGLGVCLILKKSYEEAESLLLTAHANESRILPPGHPNLREGIEKLVELYEAWGDEAQAGRWRRKLASSFPTSAPASAPSP